MEIVEHGRRVAGVREQVKMQENEPHRGQLALSEADGFWTPTGLETQSVQNKAGQARAQ